MHVDSALDSSRPIDGARDAFPTWWGPLGLEGEQPRRWRIGPRTLWVSRHRQELALAHVLGDDPLDDSLECGRATSPDDIPAEATLARFALRHDAPEPLLAARLADRAAIMRPESSLTIPSGEEVTLFVSSPVWIVVRAPASEDGDERTLVELPSWRPSDTWFGPDTRRGELAYALSITGRLSLDGAPRPPHRATTPIRVRNHEASPLEVERLKVPLPNLSLYLGADRLWTTALTLDHDVDEERATLELTSGAPTEAGADAQRLAAPRVPVTGNLVMRAFSRIFRSA